MRGNQVQKMLRKLSYTADMFKAPACLRARGQPEFSRLCPGMLSVLLGLLFSYVLLINLIELIEYKTISSMTIHETQKNVSAPHFQNISVSFSPAWQDYKDWTRKFAVRAVLLSNKDPKEQINLQLQKCKAEKWKNFNNQFQKIIMRQNICVKYPEQVKLQGTNKHTRLKLFQIQLKRCNQTNINDKNTTCMSDAEFNDSFVDLSKKKYNFYSLYIKDTSINTLKQNPLDEHITLMYNLPYDRINRKTLNIYLGTYTIQTERSIWPFFSDIDTQTGFFITKQSVVNIYKKFDETHKDTQWFGIVNIYMTTNQVRYIRKIGQITFTISYVGGLFGLIFIFFNFFVYSYNKYGYELLVAESSFNYEESGEKVRHKYFNLYKYTKFQIYYWLKRTFNKTPKWVDCQMILRTKDEANLYLDVEYLFRKLRLIDLGLCQLVDERQTKMLYLTQPPSLAEVEERRRYLQYYDSIIEGKLAVNIEDIRSQDFRISQVFTRLIGGPSIFIIPTENTLESSPAPLKLQEDSEDNKLSSEFRKNLGISDQKILEAMINFKQAYYEVKQIELSTNMEKAEVEFARAYSHASQEVRNQIIDKIPLKILFRLSNCIGKMRNSQEERVIIETQPEIRME